MNKDTHKKKLYTENYIWEISVKQFTFSDLNFLICAVYV